MPPAAPPRYLVHILKVLTQIAVVGLDIAAFMLAADGTDKIRIDDDSIGFDHQNTGTGEDEIMRHSTVRRVDRLEGPHREPHPFVTERRTGLAMSCRTRVYPRSGAGNFGPFVFFDPEGWRNRGSISS